MTPPSRDGDPHNLTDPGYCGRPVDDPDGESAALVQEWADLADEIDRIDRETEQRLSGGELERRREEIMSRVRGDRAVTMPDRPDHPYDGCGTCITWRTAGGEFRAGLYARADDREGAASVYTLPDHLQPAHRFGEPVIVLPAATAPDFGQPGKTWAELLDEYGEALISWRELDHSAEPRYKALRARVEAALVTTPPPGAWFEPFTVTCAAGGCDVEATTKASHDTGPWVQLAHGLGWRRNGSGAWECPGPHDLAVPA